jgi:hypothetical protein
MNKWKRSAAGSYMLAGTDWLVQRNDGVNETGYRWVAMHPDKGEHFADTYAEAKGLAEGKEQGAQS